MKPTICIILCWFLGMTQPVKAQTDENALLFPDDWTWLLGQCTGFLAMQEQDSETVRQNYPGDYEFSVSSVPRDDEGNALVKDAYFAAVMDCFDSLNALCEWKPTAFGCSDNDEISYENKTFQSLEHGTTMQHGWTVEYGSWNLERCASQMGTSESGSFRFPLSEVRTDGAGNITLNRVYEVVTPSCEKKLCKRYPEARRCKDLEDFCKRSPRSPGCPQGPCDENPKAPGCPAHEEFCRRDPQAPGCWLNKHYCSGDPYAFGCPRNDDFCERHPNAFYTHKGNVALCMMVRALKNPESWNEYRRKMR